MLVSIIMKPMTLLFTGKSLLVIGLTQGRKTGGYHEGIQLLYGIKGKLEVVGDVSIQDGGLAAELLHEVVDEAAEIPSAQNLELQLPVGFGGGRSVGVHHPVAGDDGRQRLAVSRLKRN